MSTVLVTGGTGNTGRPLCALLRTRGARVRAASRHPDDAEAVRFDWHDPATHGAALDGVDAVYLVPPLLNLDPMTLVGPFLDTARRLGVRKVVLLGSLAVLPNAPGVAEMYDAVRRAPEWVVLRPSGFMQNFTGPHPLAARIRERGEIRTASGGGRLGWIDAEDIASVAAVALLDPGIAGEHVLTGPESLGYRDAASTIAKITGRTIRVVDITVEELARTYVDAGMPADYAEALAGMHADIRAGSEDRVTTAVRDITGREPRSFEEFVRSHDTATAAFVKPSRAVT
ncbi:NAD(P)H-binding protein [Pseudonocardia acaciae]|uniref:NmrA family NAD(P)-binding protein n=1 Tax=Pseudonocardia acaciae TaxID=551276 RepID=UPI00055B4631|nr:NAD(P)H-binding protein [Pseudonocardia acaciae]